MLVTRCKLCRYVTVSCFHQFCAIFVTVNVMPSLSQGRVFIFFLQTATSTTFHSEMHPCLRVPEVLQRICHEVDGEYTCEGETQFSALARTCRDFQQPALARLWKSIPNLKPIIKCAADDLWQEKKVGRTSTRRLVRIKKLPIAIQFYLIYFLFLCRRCVVLYHHPRLRL